MPVHEIAITVAAVLVGWLALGLFVGLVVGECLDWDEDED